MNSLFRCKKYFYYPIRLRLLIPQHKNFTLYLAF